MSHLPPEDEPDAIVERWWMGLALLVFWSLVIMFAFKGCSSKGAEVNLSWNPNPEPDIAGYVVHYGTGSLSDQQPTGNVTSYTLTGLEPETTYQLALQAVNEAGLTSDVSAPITYLTLPPPASPLAMAGSAVSAVSSEETAREATAAANVLDGQPTTFWHTVWERQPPHYIAISLPRNAMVSALYYLPRQDGVGNGHILRYEVQSSLDGQTWQAWGSGQWANNASRKTAILPLREVRHVRLWGAETFAAAAEVELGGSYVPEPPSTVRLTVQESADLSNWNELRVFEIEKKAGQFFRLKIEKP